MKYKSISVTKEFSFDAAHRLQKTKSKCEALHGHTWKVCITVTGELSENGMVFDFTKLKEIIDSCIISQLDHTYLNDIIDQPTAENIGMWIYEQLSTYLPKISEVRVYESPSSYATLKF